MPPVETDVKKQPTDKLTGPFNERIAARMKQLGMRRLEEFADAFGLGRTTVYGLVLGRVSAKGTPVKPSVDTLFKLAEALETPAHVLLYELDPDAMGAEEAEQIPPVRRLAVTYAGWVGAGPDQDEEILDEPVWVDESFAAGRDLVAFRIRGDSMAAGKKPIFDGDTVIVDRKDPGYNTASVVARLKDNGYVCKMLKHDRHEHGLQSRNAEHTNGTPSNIPMEKVAEIVGRVIEVRHLELAKAGAASGEVDSDF